MFALLDRCQFRPEAGTGSNSTVVVGEVEFFVGAVGIVIILPPAKKQ